MAVEEKTTAWGLSTLSRFPRKEIWTHNQENKQQRMFLYPCVMSYSIRVSIASVILLICVALSWAHGGTVG